MSCNCKIYNSEIEWLSARDEGIGGSDASAIIGLNPYKTNQDLYLEKTGQRTAPDISSGKAVKYGKEAEKYLRALFILDYPQFVVEHSDYAIYSNNKYPFLLASLDGVLFEKETGRMGVLEIKTTSILQSMQKEKWNNRIPDNYFIQVLHYLIVTGFDFAVLKAQLKYEYDGELYLNTKHYRIEREDVLADLEFLLNKEIEFWQYVEAGKMPPLVLPQI